jgi:ring-1,2-phenylacetyl-CoA epoxidase subunit PaaD
VSEAATHVTIARARAGDGATAGATAGAGVDEASIRSALGEVMDPELPMVSIVDLGMVGRVSVSADAIDVEILPTFIGCPALELIRSAVTDRLGAFGRPVRVVSSFAPPWSSDRITPAGRAVLAAAGIAPPTPDGELACPLCGSGQVVMDNLFGPTQCRSLYYCRECRQPFEAIKPI